MDDFLTRAILGGIAVAITAGPLGVFVVWRRMAYFGGALSHTALLGVALGFLMGVQPGLGVAFVVVATALMLGLINGTKGLSLDTLLGIIAHAALAAGLIVVGMLKGVRIDLMGYLFGDILSVGKNDVIWLWGGAVVVLLALVKLWRPLLSVTVHADLAHVEGVSVRWTEVTFMVLLAIVVALAMKVVGIVLVTSMLVIPAAAARSFSKTPEAMAFWAVALGIVSVVTGLWASYTFDAPAGPAIVAASAVLFAASLLKR